jgi:large subunit ribosomal protein L23
MTTHNTLNLLDIIRFPLVTEKSTNVSEHNQVFFAVALSASKADIKKAVEHVFNVKVKAVNTVIEKGKQKRFRGFAGRQENIKKAMVTLEKGHQIDIAAGL